MIAHHSTQQYVLIRARRFMDAANDSMLLRSCRAPRSSQSAQNSHPLTWQINPLARVPSASSTLVDVLRHLPSDVVTSSFIHELTVQDVQSLNLASREMASLLRSVVSLSKLGPQTPDGQERKAQILRQYKSEKELRIIVSSAPQVMAVLVSPRMHAPTSLCGTALRLM